MSSSKRSILFDLASTQPNEAGFHGGGEYAKVVFQRLLQLKNEDKISANFDPDRDFDFKIKELCDRYGVDLVPVNSHSSLEAILRKNGYDKFYSALPYEYYDIDFSNVEFIYTIHGLRHIEQPTDRYEYKFCNSFKEYSKYLYKQLFTEKYREKKREQFRKLFNVKCKSSIIIVPSLHTKYSLLVEFPELEIEEVKVLYSPLKKLPSKETLEGKNLLKDNYGVESRNFYLITSARRWIKNAYRTVKSFDELFSEHNLPGKKVVVLGVSENDILQKGLNNPDRFIFRGYVSENDLSLLYSEAYSFVYPTLNEGFGYPPLESMKYGTPVLTAATTSIYEVCGDAALYFNPLSKDELKNRILAISMESGLWESFSEKSYKRYEQVSLKQEEMLDELCQIILK